MFGVEFTVMAQLIHVDQIKYMLICKRSCSDQMSVRCMKVTL